MKNPSTAKPASLATVSLPFELAEDILEDLCELRGSRIWRQHEARRGYAAGFKALGERINRLHSILANKPEMTNEQDKPK